MSLRDHLKGLVFNRLNEVYGALKNNLRYKELEDKEEELHERLKLLLGEDNQGLIDELEEAFMDVSMIREEVTYKVGLKDGIAIAQEIQCL